MTFRPQWLSQGYEDLLAVLEQNQQPKLATDFDVVIVGSGYGGAVAAARLACATEDGRRLRVCVLERGREYVPGTFPRRFADLPGHVRFSRGDQPGPQGRHDGLYDFRIGNDVSALVGSGLGGGSLINAGVAERPRDDVFEDAAWPAALRRDLRGPQDPNSLRACYARAEKMLEVRPAPADHYAKYFEFDALSMRLRVPRARPARVARHFKDPVEVRAAGPAAAQNGPRAVQNAQGVWQQPCLECGDCVTGCNVWAKNTLPMNYLARARRAQAELYTNVTVSRIARSAARDGWELWFHPTAKQHPPAPPPRSLRARLVILAAGTFGSTEILMRSRSRHLRLSACLGKRFSTNGDMISVLYGQGELVNAAPEEAKPLGERNVGPTITGVIETRGTRAERVLIEELAIPGALRRVFEEVVTTGALPVQLGRIDWSLHGPQGADPAAVDPEKICRSQIFAAMGDDGAAGRLALVEGWERAEGDGAICVDWPDAGKAAIFERQDEILSRADGLGALYLRNPLWKPLPERLAGLFSGKKPAGKLFTVHPLGGCPMGDDADSGVVDDLGRVFDPPDNSEAKERGNVARTYDGLLVLDGSIVPVALGVNPLLTIAALAERAVARYALLRDWKFDAAPLDDLPALPAGVRSPTDDRPRQPNPAGQPVTALRFAETMAHTWPVKEGEKEARKLVLDVVFDDIPDIPKVPRLPKIADLPAFLRTGPHIVPIASATLTLHRPGEKPATAALSGTVSWMERGRTSVLSRVVAVGLTWLRLRGVADLIQMWRDQGIGSVRTALRNALGAIAVCSQAGEVRYLEYNLELREDMRDGGDRLAAGTRIKGLKTFKYAGGGNPWRQLTELAVSVQPAGGPVFGARLLEIDLKEFFRRFAVQLQITGQRDQPAALMDLASLALFMTRVVLKSHFWSFRLPEYEKYDPESARRRLPQRLKGLKMKREEVRVVPEKKNGEKAKPPLTLLLTRYWQGKLAGKQPVLLIHGFGASGAQFAHAGLENNLVKHLAQDRGLDVWVAELRTSIALPSSYDQWTLDEVATEDIPALVQAVRKHTRGCKPDVVAHCIGSAMFCTAVLAGKLEGQIHRAVLLQVGPLITLSDGNIVRGRAASALRRYMLTDHVDSSVDDRADWVNGLIDRALFTYPYDDEEAPAHRLCPPWEPKTHIANCNRSAAVFGRLFQHANLDAKTLDLLGDLLGHTNLTTFEQTVHYAFLGRLTDRDGSSIYVTDHNVGKYFNFPVRFVHGAKNDVFDPETTRRSLALLQDVFGKDDYRDADDPASGRPGAGRPDDPWTRRKVIPGYGHLDPLVGRNAHRDVFPWISGFLPAGGPAFDGEPVAARHRHVKKPLIGPLLGALGPDRDTGQLRARIWCRTDDEQSFGYFLIAVVLDGRGRLLATYKAPLVTVTAKPAPNPAGAGPAKGKAGKAAKPVVLETADTLGELDLLGVIDVPLTNGHDDYEIVIVSAHDATGEDPQHAERRNEQASAQKEERLAPELLLDENAEFACSNLGPAGKGAPPTTLEGYGEQVVRLREGWIGRVREGASARRACDKGYDEGPDSVLISGRLLKATVQERQSISFAVASCRYAASRVDREQADAMFGRLRELIEAEGAGAEPPSLLVLAGDQIYADATAGMFDPKGPRERFYDSYREVWTAPNAREVLRRIPTYMMLDDHEVGDNWHPADAKDRFDNDKPGDKETVDWGLTAFREFQLAHSPWRAAREAGPYHYEFEAGGFGFFVCDTRTAREGRASILGARQFDALKRWLRDRQASDPHRPKFIVSPSVVLPFLSETGGGPRYAMRSDGWDGFPASLRELFELIAAEEHRNVVFLSGDPHISMACGIDIRGRSGAALRAASIVASPMYAPFPFANAQPREFLERAEFPAGGAPIMRYELQAFDDGQKFVIGDSFALLNVRKLTVNGKDRWRVGAEVRLRAGGPRSAGVDLG